MRRRSDGWLNATQILKVAGVEKGKRTKVLEKEILAGEHEKVQGGYGKYQGTWISYKRGREFCRQYGVEDILRPLLDYDVSADGSGNQGEGQQDTPTKEQAMAANRKRLYTPAFEGQRSNSGVAGVNGTLFGSETASKALDAINKAARYNSPAPRPGSVRQGGFRPSSQQDALADSSQQSIGTLESFAPDRDSGYNTQPNGEPPRKRIRPDSPDGSMAPPVLPMDTSMQSLTPTEPNESFLYDGMMSQEYTNGNGDPIALQPLPNPTSEEQQEKMNLILDLFAEAGRTDYTHHPALQQLSGDDLNLPLDASANNALHWAATLAKVSLLRLLIQKGANIYRGNAAGQSPLISAVLVNNCWEHSCFPELLDLLGGLIEVRDLQGRTILHHIAVSSGIKGRAPSSKYYLEALLEFLVRIGTSKSGAQDLLVAGGALLQSSKGAVSLVRFLSHIVNARDKAGNTALNLVARIGNRFIIQQLLEIHADPGLPNYKGISARDFGVGVDVAVGTQQTANQLSSSWGEQNRESEADTVANGPSAASQVDMISRELTDSVASMLTQSLASHRDFLQRKTEQLDELNVQIREYSSVQKAELQRVTEVRERIRSRNERRAKIENLKRVVAENKEARGHLPSAEAEDDVESSWLNDTHAAEILSFSPSLSSSPNPVEKQFLAQSVPPASQLRTLVAASNAQNDSLQSRVDELKARSLQLESMYCRVVSLCTGVSEDRIDESLPQLVAAVESEKGAILNGEVEVGRVREFLRKVDPSCQSTANGTVGAAGG